MATEAAWCAADQEKYFEYQRALYENTGMPLNRGSLAELAADLGLDREALAQCLSDGTHQDDLENARRAAVNQGVNSTPIFFINGQRVEGNQPYERFQQIINQQIAQ